MYNIMSPVIAAHTCPLSASEAHWKCKNDWSFQWPRCCKKRKKKVYEDSDWVSMLHMNRKQQLDATWPDPHCWAWETRHWSPSFFTTPLGLWSARGSMNKTVRETETPQTERKKGALSGCISLWSEVCWMWQRALLSSRNKDPGCSFFMNQSTRRGAVTQPNFSSQTAEHLTWGNSVTWFDW